MRRVMAVWIISSSVSVACPQNWPEWLWWENGMSDDDDDELDDGCVKDTDCICEVGNACRRTSVNRPRRCR